MAEKLKRKSNLKFKYFVNYVLVGTALVLCIILGQAGMLSRSALTLLPRIAYSIILAVSLNLVVGFLGELSLGHAGFMCVGAYIGCYFANYLHTVMHSNLLILILSMLLGGVSEIVYDNTASIGQLKGRTEEGLADELRNYMANYQGSSDGELDVAAALDLLKQKRKRLEQEQKKTLAGLEKRKEELETKISIFTEECRQSEENLQQAKEQMKRDIYQKDVPSERVRKMKKESRKSRKWGAACVALAGFLLFLCILQFFHIDSLLTRTGLGLAIAALLYLAYSLFRHRKTEVEQVVTEPEEQAIRRQQWNVDRLKQELGQKQTVLSNLQSEYEELCISMTEKDHLQEELDALSLAGETIQRLSVQMQSRIGDRLKQQMSKTLSSLTNGRYLQVNMDENLRIGLHTADEYVPLEQVSRGTIEQAYFALRMAAMDVLCGEEELPVILDESFAFYDENRLEETLKWLAENRTQVLLFTCQKREEEALSEMGIPYRKIVLK